jgi:glycosyltransferase involved in cell wall biosynthesis
MARTEEVIAFFHANKIAAFKQGGIEYYFTGYNRFQLLFPIRLNSHIKSLRPDVVIIHGLTFPLQVQTLRWQLGPGVRIIAQHHAERPLTGIRKYIQRRVDSHIQNYLFCSTELGKQWIDQRLIADPKKICEIMEVSSTFHPLDKEKAQVVSGVNGKNVFLWIGGLHNRKDPLLTVRAFLKFHKVNPDVRLIMIYQSEELLNELKQLVIKNEASSFIDLRGRVDHDKLIFWFNSADFIISSSHYEGSGIAVCEAMSCGCIPILTDIPSFRMMTAKGRAGILYEAGDEQGLTSALQQALNSDREHFKKIVLEQFRRELSFDAISKKMLDVIKGHNKQPIE